MPSVIRFMLLGMCAAAGVGLAVSVALQLEPALPPPGAQAAEETAESAARPSPQAASAAPAVARATPAAERVQYDPLIANQVNQMEHALAQVREESDRTRWFLDRALSLMSFQRTEPTAAPAGDMPSSSVEQAELLPPTSPVALGAAQISAGEGDGDLIINIKDRDIREVLELLSQQGNLNILPSKNVSGTISASLNGVSIDTALDVILKSNGYISRRDGNFIYVGTPQDLEQMDVSQELVQSRVYRPNYVTAAELMTLIQPMLTPTVGVATVSSPAAKDIPADTDSTGGDSFAGGDVLLVRDYPSKLVQVDRIVMEVDQRPQQVAIEAMILSVSLDDRHELGVNFEALRDEDNLRIVSGSPMDSLGSIDVTQSGLKFGFLDNSLGAFVNALESVGDTNVIASPRLMCLNKQRAEILIGSQLGYVSTTVTENAATQAIEFLEVGTQLRLRPYISSDGMVRLEVHPELSTGTVRVEEGFTLPDKEVTQVTTNIMCPDGCTVIIGGLIREDLAFNTSQLPVLGAIPILGHVFRQKTETMDRREIIVLITPRIVGEPMMCAEGAQASCEFFERRGEAIKQSNHWSKRHYGRRYLELAEKAWQAGDQNAARRYIQLSLYFDPMNLDAIRVRDQICGNVISDGLPPGQVWAETTSP